MTALDPSGLLPDSTTLESLYPSRLTARAWNAICVYNTDHHRRRSVNDPDLRTVADVRLLGTRLRRLLQDVKAEAAILAAIRTDWADGADAEPVERPYVYKGVAGVPRDELELRMLWAELLDLRKLLDQQRGGERCAKPGCPNLIEGMSDLCPTCWDAEQQRGGE